MIKAPILPLSSSLKLLITPAVQSLAVFVLPVDIRSSGKQHLNLGQLAGSHKDS